MSPGPIRTATAAATDVGRRRSDNEDRYAVWTSDDDPAGSPEALLVVCDGMGGSNAGEVASRLAVDTVLRLYEEHHGEDPLEALTAVLAVFGYVSVERERFQELEKMRAEREREREGA